MDTDPIITYSLLCGMWWILPLLAMTSSECYAHFKKGTYNKCSRISLKVKGACYMFRLAKDSADIKRSITNHIDLIFPFKHNTMSCIQRHSNRLYKDQKKACSWSTLLRYDLKFGHLHMSTTIFHLVQIGVIIMKYNLQNSIVFKLLETHVDNAIYRICRDNKILKKKNRMTTFRKVVTQVLESEFSFLFLYSFQKRNDLIRLSEYAALSEVFKKCERHVSDDCISRLPSCVKGGIALLSFTSTIRKNKNVTNNVRVCYSSYKEYMEMTSLPFEDTEDVDVIEILD
jgi:hypothetical protein